MLGIQVTEEQLQSIVDRAIQEADLDGDDAISFDEFKKVKCRLPSHGDGGIISRLATTQRLFPSSLCFFQTGVAVINSCLLIIKLTHMSDV